MSVEDFQKAARTKDVELAMSALADDVVLHSPLTDSFTFDGKEDIRRLFEAAYEKFDGLEYHTVIGGRVLVGGATVGGQPIEETLIMDLNEDGRIREITLFIRPLPGLTAVMAALGPTLARKNGRRTGGLLRLLTAPLVAATRFGDRGGLKLALPKATTRP
jgi:SnoaL-like domain